MSTLRAMRVHVCSIQECVAAQSAYAAAAADFHAVAAADFHARPRPEIDTKTLQCIGQGRPRPEICGHAICDV